MENLLNDHPEGLDKHIRVYDYTNPSALLTEQQILATYSQYEIPYFVHEQVYPHRRLLVVLGSDLTCNCEWFWEKYVTQECALIKTPDIRDVAAALNQLKYYTDLVHSHLKQRQEDVMVLLVGVVNGN